MDSRNYSFNLRLSLVVLALETFPESYSVTLWVVSEKRANQTKVLVVWN